MNKKRKQTIVEFLYSFIRYKIWGNYKRGGIVGLYHWFRCHTWNRYHTLSLKTSGAGNDMDYDWGFADRDRLMFIACFNILKEFVEKETPEIGLKETIDDYVEKNHQFYEGEKEQLQAQIDRNQEVRFLYNWWTSRRKIDHDACEMMLDGVHIQGPKERYNSPEWNEWMKRSDKLEERDEEMLLRLIKIRGCLWT